MTAPLYSVTDWQSRYENNRSRVLKELSFVLVPNNHDSEVYALIMAHKKAATIFAAWILILQVASRCEPRGTLVKQSGQPHDAASLALRTRAQQFWFEDALPILAELGWLSCNSLPVVEKALVCRIPAPECREHVNERKKEGIERKNVVGRTATAVPAPISLESLKTNPAYAGIDVTVELAKCEIWCQLYKRQPTLRRFVAWLNRIERPMAIRALNRPQKPTLPEFDGWKAILNREFENSIYSAGGQLEAHEWKDLPDDARQSLWTRFRKGESA